MGNCVCAKPTDPRALVEAVRTLLQGLKSPRGGTDAHDRELGSFRICRKFRRRGRSFRHTRCLPLHLLGRAHR